MVIRKELETRERQTLAPYAAKAGDSAGRAHPEAEHPFRTAYQRDQGRIVHCTAFRRLEYKTQVFVNHEGDHYRTRLTHTVEVAQIARTMARSLGLNEDLTEAVALAHDLGHTPFGHSGEDALRELMKDHGGFEHNRHGLRVVDVLERRYEDFSGLNLTYEVREAIAKHSTAWDNPAAGDFGACSPTLEAQVVELADSIAYDNHDLDDGLASGLIAAEDLESVALWREARENAGGGRVQDCPQDGADGREMKKLRRANVARHLVNLFVTDVVETTSRRIEELEILNVEDVRRQSERIARFSSGLDAKMDELEAFLFKNLYRHHRVVRMSNKAHRFIRELFTAYAEDTRQLPPEHQARVAAEGTHQAVCDYIAGMTDRYAQDQYLKLFQPFERM
ncbi:MAG TPA: deoxyguanosinetriphosphate triphosphohydrolase [Candidatus Brocadiia bacterium]|nr:deoxyguanosinetriphosphate triphosphohydrolase [Candidatus Brocadiia bacterium]